VKMSLQMSSFFVVAIIEVYSDRVIDDKAATWHAMSNDTVIMQSHVTNVDHQCCLAPITGRAARG